MNPERPAQPDPRPIPQPPGGVFAAIHRLASDPLAALPALQAELGDIYKIDVPWMPTVILTDPALVHAVLTRDFRSYRKDYFTRQLGDLLGEGLLLAEGDPWKRNRRMAQPAFHHQAIAGYGEVMVGLTNATVDGWSRQRTLDLHHEMMTLTLRIVARTLFGHDIADDAARIGQALDTFMATAMGVANTGFRLPAWIPTPANLRHVRALREVDAIVYRMIDEHRKSGDRTSLLGMLIAATDDGGGLTDQQLRDESVTLLMAGHETTALALTMALYLLSQHPNVEARIQAEVDGLPGAPSVADFARLPYTRCVVAEAMRLYPPAWSVGREPLHDVRIGDHVVPKGCHLWMPQWVIHRDARWYADPLAFQPERWEDGTLEKTLPDGAYLPFGAGPRVCIGKRFAELEAVLVLATIVRRYALRLEPGEVLALTPSVTLRPTHGLRMVATERAPIHVAA